MSMPLPTLPTHRRRQILLLLTIALGVALGFEILLRFLYEASGAFNDDSPVYWTVGRGIVNGFVPYRDLLEIKPPGIFLVSALSYALTGTMSFGFIEQGLVFVLLPLAILSPLLLRWTMVQDAPKRLTSLLFLLGVAGAVTMFTALTSGEFQTESFGMLFAALYVGAAWMLRERTTALRLAMATFGFFGAAFFKEPFVLAMAVAGLLFCRSWKDMLWILIVPGALAGALFFLGIAVSASLSEYVFTYLPFMINDRSIRYGTPMLRSVFLELTAASLWSFSPFFAATIASVWVWLLARNAKLQWRLHRDKGLLILMIIGIAATYYGAQTDRTLTWKVNTLMRDWNTYWIIAGLIMSGGSILAIIRPRTERFRHILSISTAILALWMTGYLAGMAGDFVPHHFAFALPIYLAMLYLFLEEEILSAATLSRFAILLTTLVVAAGVIHARTDTVKGEERWRAAAASDTELAAAIDGVLDACNETQYLIVGELGNNVFGYTKHSPMGPIFFQHTFATGYMNFLVSFLNQLHRAPVIITKLPLGRPHVPGVMDYVSYAFTEKPPVCAKGHGLPPNSGLTLLFREKSPEISLKAHADGSVYVDFPRDTK